MFEQEMVDTAKMTVAGSVVVLMLMRAATAGDTSNPTLALILNPAIKM